VSHDPTEMCELLVGLPDVAVLSVTDRSATTPLRVEIETRVARPVACAECGAIAHVKDRPRVSLVDLPAFGRATRLVWVKRRWCCPDPRCGAGSWTELEPRIASARMAMTSRAGKWATFQVGKHGRTVAEVADELGCDWHTINDAVIAYGSVLVDDPGRIGEVEALGLDEVLFARRGKYRTKQWSTSIVDVKAGRLLDVVEGRDSGPACVWLKDRGPGWCGQIRYGTLDLSGPYRAVFDTMLPDATQVADPFHFGEGAPRGAMCSGSGARPDPPVCRSRPVKLEAV
jgi:transposase